MERANFSAKDKTLELRFIGKTETEQAPRVALYAIEKGVIRKVESIEGNKISLAELARNVKEGTYGFGIITQYRASDTAAVALEKVSCLDMAAIPKLAERIELLK